MSAWLGAFAAAGRFRPALVEGTVASLPIVSPAPSLRAQDLTPRAYFITPVRSNAGSLPYSYNDGKALIEGAVPITGAWVECLAGPANSQRCTLEPDSCSQHVDAGPS